MMKKIVITGGSGFLGSRIIMNYGDRYDIVSATSDKLDLTDENSVLKFIKNEKPDLIIHAAAVAETKFCDENREIAYNINVRGSVNIAKACEAARSKLIFFSTEQVFNGNENNGPYDETDSPVPNTQYGETKLAAEKEVQALLEKSWILRLTWLFGLPERNLRLNTNVLWETLSSAYLQTTQKVPVNEYRGMTYVYDVVDQLEKVFTIDYGIYHIGSQNHLNRYEIAKHILETIGLSKDRIDDLLIADTDKYKDQKRDIRLNTQKIKSSGLIFEDTRDTIVKCLKEFCMIKG